MLKQMIAITGFMVIVTLSAGCQSYEGPQFFKMTKEPKAKVVGVKLLENTDDGARFAIVITANNPNEKPLSLLVARYTLHIEGMGTYKGETNANATLPALSDQEMTFTAAIGERVTTDQLHYRVGGSIQFKPPGELRTMALDIGVPMPSFDFISQGDVAILSPAAQQPKVDKKNDVDKKEAKEPEADKTDQDTKQDADPAESNTQTP